MRTVFTVYLAWPIPMRLMLILAGKRSYPFAIVLPALAVALLFTVVVASLSLTNHGLFRTYALDLGMFNHALYQLCQFQNPVFSLGLDGRVVPFLADHFSPIVYLLAWPFIWIGSSYLLWIQILLVPVFCFYAWKLAIREGVSGYLAWMVPATGMTGWMVYAAYGFDFHMNVLAAMLVVPMWYSFIQKKWIAGLFFWLLILLSKENMALWLSFITSAIVLFRASEFSVRERLWLWTLSGASMIYFIVVVSVVMPWLHPDDQNVQLAKYVGSEGGLSGVVSYCLQDPFRALGLFIRTEMGVISEDKLAFLQMILLSGGLMFFLSPRVLWMAIPILAQKVLSVNPGFWGIEAQYSIEFLPLITLAAIDVHKVLKPRAQFVGLAVGIAISAYATITIYMPESNRSDIFSDQFRKEKIDVVALKEDLKRVPSGVAICSNSCLAPHLGNRDRMFHFPFAEQAQCLVLLKSTFSTYPMKNEDYKLYLEEMKSDPDWILEFDGAEIMIYQRK